VSGGRVRKRVKVYGDVQGVFFRDSTRSESQTHEVAGWVTNNPDGSVEAVFEGELDAVEAMIDFARTGPRSADVRDIEVSDEEPEGLSGFDVR
jgi:acylphosphatase